MALLNYSQVANILHYSSYNSAKNRINKYKKELKQYIQYDKKGKFIGFDENGIEALRNIGSQNKSYKKQSIQKELDIKDIEIKYLKEQNELLKLNNNELRNENERLRNENKVLSQCLGFFGNRKYHKLLGYKQM